MRIVGRDHKKVVKEPKVKQPKEKELEKELEKEPEVQE